MPLTCIVPASGRRLLAAVDTERHAPIPHYGASAWTKHGGLALHHSTRRAFLAGVDLHLTCHQFRLLRALCDAEGAIVTWDELSRAVYGERTGNDRERIFAHIRRIRRRLEEDPSHAKLLITVRGEGFRLAT